uniref:Uncharacterized protein n=1 Tax=Phenylobacterium glaciei TaxID=2803784 RepID=A0A974P3U1_9CAUL|nr:hypothetical protein JKL49_02105 [Phenylobacterium glaciei]
MALKAFFAAATFAAVLVGMALPSGHKPDQAGEPQIATMSLGRVRPNPVVIPAVA